MLYLKLHECHYNHAKNRRSSAGRERDAGRDRIVVARVCPARSSRRLLEDLDGSPLDHQDDM